MADHRLNDLLLLINQLVEYQEVIFECLVKAEALTSISLIDSFLESPKSVIYNYLLILNDVIEKARSMNELSLNRLLKKHYMQI